MSAFALVTRLCEKIAEDGGVRGDGALVRRLRSAAYGRLLAGGDRPEREREPLFELLARYFRRKTRSRSAADLADAAELRRAVDRVPDGLADGDAAFGAPLLLVVLLEDSAPTAERTARSFLESPLAFPSPSPSPSGPEARNPRTRPYPHFSAEIFDSPSPIADGSGPYRSLAEPGAIGSRLARLALGLRPDLESRTLDAPPRLTAPRDLTIPDSETASPANPPRTESDDASSIAAPRESPRGNATAGSDLWDEAAKLPPVAKRRFVSSSPAAMSRWRRIHAYETGESRVVSETQFILHLKYLTIGIASASFRFDEARNKFSTRRDLRVEGLHARALRSYVDDAIETGTRYRRLNASVTTPNGADAGGFARESLRDSIRQYLARFRLEIDKVFGEGLVTIEREGERPPSLLEIADGLKPLSVQIQTIARIYKVCENDGGEDNRVRGAELVADLYNEIMTVTRPPVSNILYAVLRTTCQVYFRFIQKFIFEGELEDRFQEFFVKRDNRYANSFNKQYWNRGFVIRENETVPEFLKDAAKYILLCGKSLRLLKLCNPDDPFCIMLSTDYPAVRCCLTFEEIEEQQRMYDRYRTQCLYVCGEPVTFQSLLFEKEAEKRAFREMVFMKQTETMEKLIEERKRLSRMLSANKRKRFAALREAAESAVARRDLEREKNIREEKFIIENMKVANELHSFKLEEEKKRVMAFYSEIENEVNRRKLVAEWKIKRLQLDVRRVELLTSEKANYNRARLELLYKDSADENTTAVGIVPNDKSIGTDKLSTVEENAPVIFIEESDAKNTSDRPSLGDDDIQNENVHLIEIDRIRSDINSNLPVSEIENYSAYSPSDILNSNVSMSDAEGNNLKESYQSQRLEALRNKRKVLSHEFAQEDDRTRDDNVLNNNVSEARQNRIKMLSSNFDNENNLISRHASDEIQHNTEAAKEAMRNKQKVLGHEFGIRTQVSKTDRRRDNLTLNLRNCNKPSRPECDVSDWTTSNLPLGTTPGSYVNTPDDFNERLDIETPSTFDVVPFGSPSGRVIEYNNDDDSVTKTGFRFPSVIEEHPFDDEMIAIDNVDAADNVENDLDSIIVNRSAIWNYSADELNLENFKPFVIDSTENEKFSTFDIFDKKLNMNRATSSYSNITDIIERIERSPTSGDCESMIARVDNDLLNRVEDVDLSTIATCLRRSIMIPLFYQMELVNNATLKYFLIDCDLYDHLKNICDYFFLMDGEFAKTICANIFDKLNTVGAPGELLNFATLHSILDKSFGSSVSGVNKYAENLSFIVGDVPVSFHHSSPDVLECLTLSYTVSWPLNIIFSQEAMERYAKVFRFLLKLRRISWALEHDAETLKMCLKEEFMVSKELLRSPQYHSVQLYRHMMSSLIRSLHSYILTTCLQSSWKELEKDLIDARTLDDLYCIHVVYVKKVLFRCLLNNRSTTVMKLLNDIFSVILQFHHYLNARCWHIAENEIFYTHPLFTKLRESFMMFDKLAKHFYKMITRLSECGYQPHLAELLSVLNMNDYYCTSNVKR